MAYKMNQTYTMQDTPNDFSGAPVGYNVSEHTKPTIEDGTTSGEGGSGMNYSKKSYPMGDKKSYPMGGKKKGGY